MVRLEKGVAVSHDLSHLPDAKKVSKSDVTTADVKADESVKREVPTSDNTVDEIKAFLDEHAVEYTSNDRKSDLLELTEKV